MIDTLPLPQRLALAYAPRRLRDPTLALFALDAHLAGLVRKAREPLLGQARLAWWRERVEEPAAKRPAGEPLLGLLASWGGEEHTLVELIDGWEHMLAERLDTGAIDGFSRGRASGFAGLARLAGAPAAADAAATAGRRWALADLAAHLSEPQERARVLAAGRVLGARRLPLPRSLRPLAVLDGLARRSLAGDGAPLIEGPRAGFAALRLGIAGR